MASAPPSQPGGQVQPPTPTPPGSSYPQVPRPTGWLLSLRPWISAGFKSAGDALRRHHSASAPCPSHNPALFPRLNQRPRRLTTPGINDELFELVKVDQGESDEDGREAVVVRLGEELLRVECEQRLLVELAGDADRHHVGPRNFRLLRLDALIPRPNEPLLLALVANGEGEMILPLARVRQRQRDPADVLLVSHTPRLFVHGIHHRQPILLGRHIL